MSDDLEDKFPKWQGWDDPPEPSVTIKILSFFFVLSIIAIVIALFVYTAAIWFILWPMGALIFLLFICR